MDIIFIIAATILILLCVYKGYAFYKMGEAWIDYMMFKEGKDE